MWVLHGFMFESYHNRHLPTHHGRLEYRPSFASLLPGPPPSNVHLRARSPETRLPIHQNEQNGDFVIWVSGDSDPPRRARVIEADIKVEGGVVVHIVDKILYTY